MNLLFTFFVFVLTFFVSCTHKPKHPSVLRSIREDIDLFLIPAKFNILESDWLFTRNDSSFSKQKLIQELKKYGRTLDDLKLDPKLRYREENDIITLEVAKTSHFTDYWYDVNIPIVFHGKKWFKPKVYKQVIHQQNIVPTLAKILKIPNPNGVEAKPISELLNNLSHNVKPELIVTIVIDQGGQQLYRAHIGHYPNIQRLMDESAYFPNAEVGHLDAHTAVGHAAIGTGAYPIKNKVVGNTFYFYEKEKLLSHEIYAGKDETLVDPSELATETLADILDRENEDKSEIISQCYALRASIGMAGHGSYKLKNIGLLGDRDHVYWLDKYTKRWTTDYRYYNTPYFLYQYDSAIRFHEDYPSGWRSVKITSVEEARKNYSLILASPAEVKMETEIFLRAIEEIILKRERNKDGYTDLAYITLKSTDAAGHAFGWESLEALDTLEETDRQVGKIWDFLEKNFKDEYILILTADHGCAPLPEISGGKRMKIQEFITNLNSLLPQDALQKNESLVTKMTVGQVSLNHDVLNKHKISLQAIRNKILDMEVDGKKFFVDVVFTNSNLK